MEGVMEPERRVYVVAARDCCRSPDRDARYENAIMMPKQTPNKRPAFQKGMRLFPTTTYSSLRRRIKREAISSCLFFGERGMDYEIFWIARVRVLIVESGFNTSNLLITPTTWRLASIIGMGFTL